MSENAADSATLRESTAWDYGGVVAAGIAPSKPPARSNTPLGGEIRGN